MASRPYDKRAVWGWSLYDFANSAFTTLVVTFIYAIFFKDNMGADSLEGTALWTRGSTVTAIVVALSSPFLGALADRAGIRRGLLVTSTTVCVLFTALLYVPEPGQALFALGVFIIANIAFELCGVFYNSYLPDIAPQERIGRISGYGWALGYLGGFLCMGIALGVLLLPETAPFGLDRELGEDYRAVNLLVAAWFAIFAIPMFLWVKEPADRVRDPKSNVVLMKEAALQLRSTFHEIRDRYTDIFRLLLARMIYNDGLVTIFVVGPIFVSEAFGMEPLQVLVWGVGVQVASMVGAFAMGFMDDRVGGKKTILVTIVGLAIGGVWAVMAESITSIYMAGFWVGIFVGPNQAASRSLLGRFVPNEKETEFYGFFAFSGKAIAFLGPFLFGEISRLSGNVRIGMATIISFFIIGGLLLLTVDESRGIARAEQE